MKSQLRCLQVPTYSVKTINCYLAGAAGRALINTPAAFTTDIDAVMVLVFATVKRQLLRPRGAFDVFTVCSGATLLKVKLSMIASSLFILSLIIAMLMKIWSLLMFAAEQ